ncbi:mechanosensitive ion channel protein 10-like [Benincasa hispida]|uniref:mechanosensitive ion channel protein 10-like n=1 Tax=Benincasa hispida TaxID=102211 RepID=UPI0019007E52|nr:mechanosensitive ion channel protein 10-like [Benincasa hispida]
MEVRKSDNDHLVLTVDPPEKEQISPSPTSTKTLRRLNFSKPKSRFDEPNFPHSTPRTIPESTDLLQPPLEEDSTSSSSSSSSSSEYEDEEIGPENENEGKSGRRRKRKGKRKKINKRVLIEWILFLTITTCLICSLTLESLQEKQIWSLEVWKWCLIVMVIFCGRLVSEWLVGVLVFVIERNFMLRERVLYFVYGLRKSFQNCAWLGLVLIAWMIMFPDVHQKNKVLLKVFRFLIAVLIGATVWLLKILLVKVLASSFHVATFFDRMKESVFNHYILETLSGPPLDEEERDKEMNRRRRLLQMSKSLPARWLEGGGGQILSRSKRQGSSKKIDMERLRKLSLERRPSAWSVKRLVSYVKSSGLSTISRTVDDFANAESEITSESEARNCAQRVFKNVAKPGARYIEEEDLLRFLKIEEVNTIFPLFEGAIETGKISKSAFRNWVVHAYIERKALAHSLNDTKTAVQQLHKLASAVVIVIIIVISLLVLGVATTKVLVVITSQLLLVGFMFQNTCKTIFESIIFVFVMHPFDVGDRCVIDGVHMFVEEMNILSTVFLRFDNEKIYYPNSVLLTKPISNFRRSPDMSDTVDFTIDVSTSFDNITALRKAMQIYIESKPKHWNPKHSLVVKEIENVDKMKMSLCVQHTMNHQNFPERNNRRSDLILELKRVFEILGIKYHLLPQEVVVTQFNLTNGRMAIPSS